MPKNIFAVIAALVAFAFCLAGGLLLLNNSDFKLFDGEDPWGAVGLYFIGKAVFVGAMLLLQAGKTKENSAGPVA